MPLKTTQHARFRASQRGTSADVYGVPENTRRGSKIRFNGCRACINKNNVIKTIINNRVSTFVAPDGTEVRAPSKVVDPRVIEHDTCVAVKPSSKKPRQKYRSKVHPKKWKTMESSAKPTKKPPIKSKPKSSAPSKPHSSRPMPRKSLADHFKSKLKI